MNSEVIDFDIFGHDLTAQVDFTVENLHDCQVYEIENLTILGDETFEDFCLTSMIHVFEQRIIDELKELKNENAIG